MKELDRVLGLVQTALDEFDSPNLSVSALVRRAQRVARLRGDYLALYWLELEASGLEPVAPEAQHLVAELRARYTTEEFASLVMAEVKAYQARRSWPDFDQDGTPKQGQSGQMNPASVGALEHELATARQQVASMTPPPGMHPVDLYHRDAELRRVRIILDVKANLLARILESTRQAVFRYLTVAEYELSFGQVHADLFEKNRAYVDERLDALAPEALEQFNSVFKRVEEGDPEALSQALTSCRRVLKSLADQLYPPRTEPATGSDGKSHPVTEDKVINRLMQWVFETSAGHTSADLLTASLESFGSRFDGLMRLSSKGVHDKVTVAETEQCALQTYLLIGDLLRLRDGSSSLLTE